MRLGIETRRRLALSSPLARRYTLRIKAASGGEIRLGPVIGVLIGRTRDEIRQNRHGYWIFNTLWNISAMGGIAYFFSLADINWQRKSIFDGIRQAERSGSRSGRRPAHPSPKRRLRHEAPREFQRCPRNRLADVIFRRIDRFPIAGNRLCVACVGLERPTGHSNRPLERTGVRFPSHRAKERTGHWTVNGTYVRVAPTQDAVITRLGEYVQATDFVPARWGPEGHSLLSEIHRFALQCAGALDHDLGPPGDLGIDILVDEHDQHWFIEANAGPGYLMLGAHDPDYWRQIAASLAYASYLAGFPLCPA